MRNTTLIIAGLTAITSAFLISTAARAQQEVVIFQEVPSVEELDQVLFNKPAQPKTRSILGGQQQQTRAIRFHNTEPAPVPASTPAPAPTPQPQPTAAAPEAQVASAAPVAPASPEGTALGFNILFEFDSIRVLPESFDYLDRLGEVLTLEENAERAIAVVGHTDASGGDGYNMQLSQERALAIANYLVEAWAVDPNRLQAVGMGESQLLPQTAPSDGINRRVEFVALD